MMQCALLTRPILYIAVSSITLNYNKKMLANIRFYYMYSIFSHHATFQNSQSVGRQTSLCEEGSP